MTKSEFISALLAELGASVTTATDDTKLADIAIWDSMTQIATLAMVEEKLGLHLSPTDVSPCKTVGDIIILLGENLS